MASGKRLEALTASLQRAIQPNPYEIDWISGTGKRQIDWNQLVVQSNQWKLKTLFPDLTGSPTSRDYHDLMKFTRSLAFCYRTQVAS